MKSKSPKKKIVKIGKAALKPAKKASRSASAQQGEAVVVITSNAAVARAFSTNVKNVAILKNPAAIDAAIATGARIAFIDSDLPGGENCYEYLRKLRVRSALRLVLLHAKGKNLDTSIHALARFAGAEAVISSPPTPAELKLILKPPPTRNLGDSLLGGGQDAARADSFESRLLSDIKNPHDPTLLDSICDPETRLHSSSYGVFAFDLDFKRATRFAMPLSIVIVGFEGEASTETLLELAGIFLNEIRDTDTLARFSINSFFFVLPNTLADGAKVMLERIAASVKDRGLRDLVGDKLQLTSGIAGTAIPTVESRDELFARAQLAFERARTEVRAAVVG